MTLPPKLEKLFENWRPKILSLVAAILVYAFYQISMLETRYFVIPLDLKQDADMVSTSLSESSIKISVRGKMTDVNTLEAKDFGAFADVSRFVNEGSVVVPVQLNLSDNVRIMKDIEIQLQPETVEVTLEKELASYIPVHLNYTGDTMHGYEIAEIKTIPSLIKVKGPRSLVDNLEKLDTDIILLDNLYANTVLETDLLEINSQFVCEHEGPVTVEVTVVPSQMKRNLMNVPVSLNNVSETLLIEFEKKNVTCTISGNELDVEKFSPSTGFIYADCSEIIEPGEYDISLQNKKIYQLNVDSVYPDTIHVVVTEKPVDEAEEGEE